MQQLQEFYGNRNSHIMALGSERVEIKSLMDQLQRYERQPDRARSNFTHVLHGRVKDWHSSDTYTSYDFDNDEKKNHLHHILHRLVYFKIPTSMCEMQSINFRFFVEVIILNQSVENVGTCETLVKDRLISKHADFLRTMSRCVFEAFPSIGEKGTNVLVSQTKSSHNHLSPQKMMIRFLFKDCKTNEGDAKKLRNYICATLNAKSQESGELMDILSDIRQLDGTLKKDGSEWELLISSKPYELNEPTLMPFCDLTNHQHKPQGAPLSIETAYKMKKPSGDVEILDEQNARNLWDEVIGFEMIHDRTQNDSGRRKKIRQICDISSPLLKDDAKLTDFKLTEAQGVQSVREAELERKRNRVHRAMPGYE